MKYKISKYFLLLVNLLLVLTLVLEALDNKLNVYLIVFFISFTAFTFGVWKKSANYIIPLVLLSLYNVGLNFYNLFASNSSYALGQLVGSIIPSAVAILVYLKIKKL